MTIDVELDALFAKPVTTDITSDAIPPPIAVSRRDEDTKIGTIIAESKTPNRKSALDDEERLARTIFIGNLPVSLAADRKERRSFERFLRRTIGEFESIRLRSLAPASDAISTSSDSRSSSSSKRIAAHTGALNVTIDSCNAYIVLSSADRAKEAVKILGGIIYPNSTKAATADGEPAADSEGRHLRVDLVGSHASRPDSKKSIFIGNLPRDVTEETLWKTFSTCGPVQYVRVIRDPVSRLGRGIAYVAFQDRATVSLALTLDGTKCGGRDMRISKCAKPGYKAQQKLRLAQASSSSSTTTTTKSQGVNSSQSRTNLGLKKAQAKQNSNVQKAQAKQRSDFKKSQAKQKSDFKKPQSKPTKQMSNQPLKPNLVKKKTEKKRVSKHSP